MVPFVWAYSAERERVDVAQIPNVMDHLSVVLIAVPLDRLGWDAVQSNAMVTLTAQVENAMLNTINAA